MADPVDKTSDRISEAFRVIGCLKINQFIDCLMARYDLQQMSEDALYGRRLAGKCTTLS